MNKLIETIVSAIEDKKGKNIVSLDLSGFDGAVRIPAKKHDQKIRA